MFVNVAFKMQPPVWIYIYIFLIVIIMNFNL